jgi:hypothetical protein
MDTDATGFKWLLVENNGHKVDMSDNVTFVDSSNNSVDYKVYNCNNLNNGLTVNFVDESGHILGTNENVELITSSKSGLYFRMENPAVTGDYKYELNGVDVTTNINNQQGIEMVDTYEEGATSDTVEITVYPREVETVTKNIKFVDAENPTNVVTEKNVEMEVDTTDYLLYDMPTTIEGRQIGYVVLEDGSALFGGGKNSAIAKKEDVEDEIVIKVHYEDVITYYVGNITYPVNERDGLSPYTAFNSFDQIREELRDKNYTFKDKIRIVLMNSTARTGRFVELAQYALGEEEYSYTQDSSMVLTGNGKDANAQYGTNALFYAGEDEEMPEITFTSKHNNINYNSGLIFEDRAVLVYNKITFENLTMSMQPPENASYNTYTEIMFYAQGNDLKISENVTVNLKGAGNNNTNGIERNYPLITLILGTWGSANKQYHRTVKGNGTLNPTLTINSGRWGRIIGGARMGIIGTEEEPYNPTINIGGSADVSIIMGAQTESYMYGSPTINIRENANVGKLIAATQGYDNAAFGEHTYSNATCTTGYSDESGGIPRTVNIYGGTVNNLYGASIARNTTSVADFGDTVINVMDDPEDENSGNYKATINNLYGGPAAGVMFGDITINISKANSEINNIWGAGGGASDLINKSLLGTYDSSSNLYY